MEQTEVYDVIVTGGGAAGLMAAGTAAERGARVLLIERNDRPAKKILITGKGRCNVTNDTDVYGLIAATIHGGKFLFSAFTRFGADDTVRFFTDAGVPLKVERGRRVFPRSDRAADIADALIRYASGATTVRGRVSQLRESRSAGYGVKTDDGRIFYAPRVIIATGGLSYPSTGSTGDGYRLARDAGHTVTKLAPSLVPLTVKERWVRDLQGLSLRNTGLSVFENGRQKPVYRDFGEMLFTHYGVSGPMILSASAHLNPDKIGDYRLYIDCKPALDEKTLNARVIRDFAKYSARDCKNAMSDLLPARMIPVCLGVAGVNPSAKAGNLTKERRFAIVNALKHIPLTVTGFRPISEAIVTRGGVALNEINPKTMESKIRSGLYFAGEILDADAYTGGYHLQIAFSTGRLAGLSAAERSVNDGA